MIILRIAVSKGVNIHIMAVAGNDPRVRNDGN
jgi:hypothetical protein